jgi:hypothetical protein
MDARRVSAPSGRLWATDWSGCREWEFASNGFHRLWDVGTVDGSCVEGMRSILAADSFTRREFLDLVAARVGSFENSIGSTGFKHDLPCYAPVCVRQDLFPDYYEVNCCECAFGDAGVLQVSMPLAPFFI